MGFLVLEGKKNKTRNEQNLEIPFCGSKSNVRPLIFASALFILQYQAKMSTLVDTVSDVVEMYVKVKVARLVGAMNLVQKNPKKSASPLGDGGTQPVETRSTFGVPLKTLGHSGSN